MHRSFAGCCVGLLFVPSLCLALPLNRDKDPGIVIQTHCNQCSEIESSISPTLAWQTVSGSTLNASDGDYSYSFCATAGSTYTFSFCQQGGTADYDTGLSIFGRAGGACDPFLQVCTDDFCGLLSEIIWVAPTNGEYVIKVGGFGGSTGNYTLAFTGESCCPATNGPPAFIAPSPTCGSTIAGLVGSPLSFTVRAADADSGDVVTLTSGLLPPGATMTPSLPTVGNPVSAAFDWTPTSTGVFLVAFTASDKCGVQTNCSDTIHVISNRPPDCSGAVASETVLWPPDHSYHGISILGVTDPDGDTVSITVTGITQDEPVNGRGDGNTCPDAQIVDGQASVRAERTGTPGVPGNGRVYTIQFTATDGKGGTCGDSVNVCVPHDQGRPACVDDGQRYNSPGPCRAGSGANPEAVAGYALKVTRVGNTETDVEFALPKDTRVSLAIYDVAGRTLATLEDSVLPTGVYQRAWNMAAVPRGLYFVRLLAGRESLTKTVIKKR